MKKRLIYFLCTVLSGCMVPVAASSAGAGAGAGVAPLGGESLSLKEQAESMIEELKQLSQVKTNTVLMSFAYSGSHLSKDQKLKNATTLMRTAQATLQRAEELKVKLADKDCCEKILTEFTTELARLYTCLLLLTIAVQTASAAAPNP